jgi:hypothetical protein
VTGLENCKRAQEQHLRAMQEAMATATDHAATLLFEEMYAETSLEDHSLEDLRKMGHPYRQGAPQGVPHPDWLVHHQSGDLQEGLSRTPVQVSGSTAEVEFHSEAPYTWYLLLGTRYMRPRDFVSASLYKAKGVIQKTYEFYFKNTLDVKKSERYQAEVVPVYHDEFDPQLPSR